MLLYTLANKNNYEKSFQTPLNLYYFSSLSIGVDYYF